MPHAWIDIQLVDLSRSHTGAIPCAVLLSPADIPPFRIGPRLFVNLLPDCQAVRPSIFLPALASGFTLPSGDSR